MSVAVKAEVVDDDVEHDPFAFVLQAAPPVGVKSELGGKLPSVPSFPAPEGFLPASLPGEISLAEPPAKKRKIKGALEVDKLSKLLQGMHLALQQMTRPPNKPEARVNGFEDQLKKYWKTNFKATVWGDTNMVAFLRRFPGVFNVKSNGLELLVSAVETPDFDKEAVDNVEPNRGIPEYACKFSSGLGDHVLAFMANLISEEKKVGGHVLNYQFTPFAICEDFLTRIREDEDALDDNDTMFLLDTLCDPRPQPPQNVSRDDWPTQRDDDRGKDWQDRKDWQANRDWKDNRDWRNDDRDRDGGPRGRGPNFYDRGGGDNYDRRRDDDDRPWRRDNRGGGNKDNQFRPDRRGSDGRSLCRQYQFNRCTYGDKCRFLHEYDAER